ncbi:MAG: VWA domain-containing protein [Verrucomicrobia bacterium]|nr:VWA domain-containing protein [Verrucomicrobiota bacterium]
MKKPNCTLNLTVTLFLLACGPWLHHACAQDKPVLLAKTSATATPASARADKQPLVQIAILLDTSNSMDGLIEQAKGQLWKIVNEFISAKRDGKRPEIQVALYEYGNDGLSAAGGHIRCVQPLMTDLDKISEELFALKTNGGQEYCGWVIKEAVEELEWSKASDDYKAIFITGNEPFTQGSVDYSKSCKAAIEKGIVVNTIFCGNEAEGTGTKWQSGAVLADGKYMFINHNQAVVHFDAPQDKEIAELGEKLNATYLAFGARGREGRTRQVAQDMNATGLAAQGSHVQRALSKASANYRNSNWDLVDAIKEKKLDVSQVKAEELPDEMHKMNEAERKVYVETKSKEREQIQMRINRLNAERSKFVAEQAKKQPGARTLDTAMIGAIREQAVKKNYRFE